MSNPLLLGEKLLSWFKSQDKHIQFAIKNSGIMFVFLVVVVYGSVFRLWNSQPAFYAQAAYLESDSELHSPLLEKQSQIFDNVNGSGKNPIIEKIQPCNAIAEVHKTNDINAEKKESKKENSQAKFLLIDDKSPQIFGKELSEGKEIKEFANKLYDIVGDTPISEMIPFISKRDEKVAAFLVAIAKKESSFGEHSPSLDGQDCYNYWGYKGSAGRGTSMGYACFASAEEAVKIVGDRIEVLVNKERNTPQRMVDTWKCGTSCAGDPGAPGWVATVAMYFEKILG